MTRFPIRMALETLPSIAGGLLAAFALSFARGLYKTFWAAPVLLLGIPLAGMMLGSLQAWLTRLVTSHRDYSQDFLAIDASPSTSAVAGGESAYEWADPVGYDPERAAQAVGDTKSLEPCPG